jgi:hypothetical protein
MSRSGYQSAIHGRAELQGVAACNLLPGSAGDLQRVVRDVPVQNLIRFFRFDGGAHGVVASC